MVRPKVWFVESGCCVDSVVPAKPIKTIADGPWHQHRTVETHRARMMMKMGTESIADLIQLVTSLKRSAARAGKAVSNRRPFRSGWRLFNQDHTALRLIKTPKICV